LENLCKTVSSRKKAIVLGVVFLLFLAFAHSLNVAFYSSAREIFANPVVAVLMVFVHNVLAVSLIIVGMTFYVEYIVPALSRRRKIELVVIEHPRPFALIFTVIVLFISILRASTLLYGGVVLSSLALITLLSLPNGIVEGYGVYLSILNTLKKELTMKGLMVIYSIFFIAALIEIGFVQLLLWIVTQ